MHRAVTRGRGVRAVAALALCALLCACVASSSSSSSSSPPLLFSASTADSPSFPDHAQCPPSGHVSSERRRAVHVRALDVDLRCGAPHDEHAHLITAGSHLFILERPLLAEHVFAAALRANISSAQAVYRWGAARFQAYGASDIIATAACLHAIDLGVPLEQIDVHLFQHVMGLRVSGELAFDKQQAIVNEIIANASASPLDADLLRMEAAFAWCSVAELSLTTHERFMALFAALSMSLHPSVLDRLTGLLTVTEHVLSPLMVAALPDAAAAVRGRFFDESPMLALRRRAWALLHRVPPAERRADIAAAHYMLSLRIVSTSWHSVLQISAMMAELERRTRAYREFPDSHTQDPLWVARRAVRMLLKREPRAFAAGSPIFEPPLMGALEFPPVLVLQLVQSIWFLHATDNYVHERAATTRSVVSLAHITALQNTSGARLAAAATAAAAAAAAHAGAAYDYCDLDAADMVRSAGRLLALRSSGDTRVAHARALLYAGTQQRLVAGKKRRMFQDEWVKLMGMWRNDSAWHVQYSDWWRAPRVPRCTIVAVSLCSEEDAAMLHGAQLTPHDVVETCGPRGVHSLRLQRIALARWISAQCAARDTVAAGEPQCEFHLHGSPESTLQAWALTEELVREDVRARLRVELLPAEDVLRIVGW